MRLVGTLATTRARRGDYIQTFSGRRFWPTDPDPAEITLVDIAHALSNQCRFSGHTREFYSVAEHSVRVAWGCPRELQRWGLLHDAAEAYLTDLSRPIKHLPAMEPYRAAEARVMRAVCDRFGLDPAEPPAIKVMDNILLATEVRDLMTSDRRVWRKWLTDIAPLPIRIDPWTPTVARREFLKLAEVLGLE